MSLNRDCTAHIRNIDSYLGLVKNKSDARIFGDWVVCLFVCSGTAGRALNVVVGTNWSSNANPFSSGCDC